jgi:hypothetical protein
VSVVATRTRALLALESSFGLQPLPGLLSKTEMPDLAYRMRKEEIVERGILVLRWISEACFSFFIEGPNVRLFSRRKVRIRLPR